MLVAALAEHCAHPLSIPVVMSDVERSAIADAALVARVRAGDADAFTQIYAEYCDALCRSVDRLLGSREMAEDVVHTVFMQLWEHRAAWRITSSIRSYVFAAVRYGALKQLRREANSRTIALAHRIEPWSDAADAEFEAEELRRQFARVLATLPPRTREVFILTRRDGLPYDEVALKMGISIKTVGAHVAQGLSMLRKAFAALALLIAWLQ